MENNFDNEENPVIEESVIEAPEVHSAPEEPEDVVIEEEVTPDPVAENKNDDVIEAPAYSDPAPEVPALGNVNGAIGVTTAPKESKKPAKKSSAPKKDTVALYSTKNVTWPGVGKVYRGYNIVEKDAAEAWLTRSHIRVAAPEEVAKEFGK
jgi:hypothetical protein